MSYAFYNFNMSYVQGMNDLVAPMLVVTDGDEALSFWMFASLMDAGGAAALFDHDQQGMHRVLRLLRELLGVLDPVYAKHLRDIEADHCFFAFRWFLCKFKREFSYDDVFRLW